MTGLLPSIGSDSMTVLGPRFALFHTDDTVDGAGLVQWLAIGLSFVAVIVILRYARQPRCDVCSRRHARPDHAAPPREVALLSVELPEPTDWGASSWKAE
jgi:hypothetical protein